MPVRPTPRLRTAALSVLLVALVSCSYEGPHEGPRLTQPGGDPDGWFGLRYSLVEAGEPIIMDREVILCLDRAGRVDIIEVQLGEVDGSLQVEAFAVRPGGDHYPDWTRTEASLFDLDFEPGATTVDVVCPGSGEEAGHFVHLGLQLAKAGAATARAHTLLVSYRDEAEHSPRTLTVPFGIVLCEGWTTEGDRIVDECDFIVDDHYFPDPE